MQDRSKPTLLVVAPYFPPDGGGLEKYAQEIAIHLQNEHNFRVVVITTCRKGGVESIKEEKGLTIYRLPYSFKISNTPFSFRWFFKIRKIFKLERPQIINIHRGHHVMKLICLLVVVKLRARFFTTEMLLRDPHETR